MCMCERIYPFSFLSDIYKRTDGSRKVKTKPSLGKNVYLYSSIKKSFRANDKQQCTEGNRKVKRKKSQIQRCVRANLISRVFAWIFFFHLNVISTCANRKVKKNIAHRWNFLFTLTHDLSSASPIGFANNINNIACWICGIFIDSLEWWSWMLIWTFFEGGGVRFLGQSSLQVK